MKDIDEDMMKSVVAAMDFAFPTWVSGGDKVATQSLIHELAARGYKIVKDTDQ